ncbi:hypothetical protein DP190_00010 [Enterobacter cloacae]|uniref:hypothetical protein n=1 Tax=Enterobacter sp. 148H3 TaxID=3077756 RepID=UPI000DCF3810|nr:hypothetical protein [Enterobacter sp. 148H3]RAY88508.1 hypothetical protein DP190_00010 [Enterobacter cloacae]
MNILIIEDNEYKTQKIIDFISSEFPESIISSSRSYSSGVSLLSSESFDFAIIDMSLPTFDKDAGMPSSEFRTFGGMDIAKFIKRKRLTLQYILLTQYISFASDDKSYDLTNIEKMMTDKYPENYRGCIKYDNSSIVWKEAVKELMV